MNESLVIHDKSGPADRATAGPLDLSEVSDVRPFVDFGALRIFNREALQLRLEVEESTQRVVALTLEHDNSSLQLQAFAAPRNEGLWHEIRTQLADSITQQGGSAEERIGAFGPELLVKIPVQPETSSGPAVRLARFIGVDGPRWFLRGIVGGAAMTDAKAAADIDDLFRSIVVVRGETPIPPRDLLNLTLPDSVISQPRSI